MKMRLIICPHTSLSGLRNYDINILLNKSYIIQTISTTPEVGNVKSSVFSFHSHIPLSTLCLYK